MTRLRNGRRLLVASVVPLCGCVSACGGSEEPAENHPSSGGFSATAGSAGSSGSSGSSASGGTAGAAGTAGTAGFGIEAGPPDSGGYGCSADLHAVIDASGAVVEACPGDQGCSNGACVAA